MKKTKKLDKFKLARFIVVISLVIAALVIGIHKFEEIAAQDNAKKAAIATQVTKLVNTSGVIDVNKENAFYVSQKKDGNRKLLIFTLDDTLNKLQQGTSQHYDNGLRFASKMWLSENSEYFVVNTLSVSPTCVVYQVQ